MTNDDPRASHGEGETLPLATEELDVRIRKVERGAVRVSKRVREHEELLEQPLTHEEVEVERIAIGRPVETAPEPRYEGDVLVVPVVAEVAVLTKQLVLKEELRIRRRPVTRMHRERVQLRSEDASVERTPPAEK